MRATQMGKCTSEQDPQAQNFVTCADAKMLAKPKMDDRRDKNEEGEREREREVSLSG